jgi:hypothetical protein
MKMNEVPKYIQDLYDREEKGETLSKSDQYRIESYEDDMDFVAGSNSGFLTSDTFRKKTVFHY